MSAVDALELPIKLPAFSFAPRQRMCLTVTNDVWSCIIPRAVCCCLEYHNCRVDPLFQSQRQPPSVRVLTAALLSGKYGARRPDMAAGP